MKTKKIRRRRWPTIRPCECSACRSIRLQINRIKTQNRSTTK